MRGTEREKRGGAAVRAGEGRRGARAPLVAALATVVLAGTGWWALADREGEPAERIRAAVSDAVGRSGSASGPDRLGTAESGAIAKGDRVTPFDTDHPALGRLDRKLLTAVQQAAEAARRDGIEFHVTSGWRSAEYQRLLLDRAVRRHGGLAKAKEFVATPEKSGHVTGTAIDIGPTDADDWLIRKGARFGLCQVYANEMWHFELLTEPGGTCPTPLPNASG
ncbi:M15 family metallopeptidase [Streptomyces sp. NPDC057638]|uniref:M15 family metallopeptidase n=1 Tax=Streptomyces sp. NPDC057638 TaxID=3346190 RepID=UPI003695BEDA